MDRKVSLTPNTMTTEPTWEQLAVKAKELVADLEKMRKPAWTPAFKVGDRVVVREYPAHIWKVKELRNGCYLLERDKPSDAADWMVSEEEMQPATPPDKWADVKQARADGKAIQFRNLILAGSEWETLHPAITPSWADIYEYRIKPWSLQPPPHGEWHRSDWQEEMLEGGWRPLLKGENRQRDDEYNSGGEGVFCKWNHDAGWSVDGNNVHFRTRRPLPPPPDPEREAFERVAAEVAPSIHLSRGTDGKYEWLSTEQVWLLWQAARKSRS